MSMRVFGCRKVVANACTNGSVVISSVNNTFDIYFCVNHNIYAYTPIITNGTIEQSALDTIAAQNQYGSNGIHSTRWNSGCFTLGPHVIQDLNYLILDTLRLNNIAEFACVDMVSMPYNYFHLYKYYDELISFTPV